MTRRRALVAAAAVVAVVVAVAAWSLWPRGAREVSEEEALEDFRSRTTTASSTADEAGSSDAPTTPAPGVYTYRATGEEEVKLGPLPTETRTLPETVTAVVVDDGDGCFTLTLNLFAEHTEDTRYCVADDGTVTLAEHVKHQRIGALSPTATVGCDPDVLVVPGSDTTDLRCDLSLAGGPATITAELVGTASTAAVEARTVGGTEVEATPLTIAYEVSGDLDGTWTETLWLAPDHLPLRIERTLDLAGPATFTERSELDLVDLTPST